MRPLHRSSGRSRRPGRESGYRRARSVISVFRIKGSPPGRTIIETPSPADLSNERTKPSRIQFLRIMYVRPPHVASPAGKVALSGHAHKHRRRDQEPLLLFGICGEQPPCSGTQGSASPVNTRDGSVAMMRSACRKASAMDSSKTVR